MPDLRRHAALAGLLLPLLLATPAIADAAVAPAAPVPVPANLQGAHPIVRWRNLDDAHVVRVVVRRLEGTVAPASLLAGAPVFDGPPAAEGTLQAVSDTVEVGHTYTYGFWSVGPDGQPSSEAAHSLTANAVPVPSAPALASDVGTVTRFLLSWGAAGNPVGTHYTVKYAVRDQHSGALGPWTDWLVHQDATQGVFGGHGLPLVPKAGVTYHFEFFSQDDYGNDTRQPTLTVEEPYDTRAAVASAGWTTLPSAIRWAGTTAAARKPGSSLRFTVVGSAVTVVADRCPDCGKVIVKVDGRTRAVLDTHAITRALRQQVGTVSRLSLARHVVLLQVVGTTGHPTVKIDGLAALD
jgi:hypothetical protein